MLDQVYIPELELLRQERKSRDSSLEQSFVDAALACLDEKIAEYQGLVEAGKSTGSAVNHVDMSADLSSYLYYHQSRDGLNVFIHPISMKILRYEFGEYWSIPGHLDAPVLQCERLLVTAMTRKRYRYLEHLPTGSQIILVEVELKDVVSRRTLKHFEKELLMRRSVRRLRSAAAATAKHETQSILDEWRQMEDDYYSQSLTSNGIAITPAPEILNLDDLDDVMSFPSISNSTVAFTSSPINVNRMAGSGTAAWSLSNPGGPGGGHGVGSFADVAASPPSFSVLACSLNSPFFPHQTRTKSPFPGLAPAPHPSRPTTTLPAPSSPSFANALASDNNTVQKR